MTPYWQRPPHFYADITVRDLGLGTFRNGVRWSFVEARHIEAFGHGLGGASHRDIHPWFLDDEDKPLGPDIDLRPGSYRAGMYVLFTDFPWNAAIKPGLRFIMCSGLTELADGVVTSETSGLTSDGDGPKRPVLPT